MVAIMVPSCTPTSARQRTIPPTGLLGLSPEPRSVHIFDSAISDGSVNIGREPARVDAVGKSGRTVELPPSPLGGDLGWSSKAKYSSAVSDSARAGVAVSEASSMDHAVSCCRSELEVCPSDLSSDAAFRSKQRKTTASVVTHPPVNVAEGRRRIWFDPPRMRLCDVQPRKILQESHGYEADSTSKTLRVNANCVRLRSSCTDARLHRDVRGFVYYTLVSKGTASRTLVPVNQGHDILWEEREDEDTEKDIDSEASIGDSGRDGDGGGKAFMEDSGSSPNSLASSLKLDVLPSPRPSSTTSGAASPPLLSLMESCSSGPMISQEGPVGSKQSRSLGEEQHNFSSGDVHGDSLTSLSGTSCSSEEGATRQGKHDGSIVSLPLIRTKVDSDSNIAAFFACKRKNHPTYLRDRVYAKRCSELNISINSGVENLILRSKSCFCDLEMVSFSDFLLGDRGVEGILPLFKACRRLKSLNLVGNSIRQHGLKILLKTLQDPDFLKCLAVLDLSRNPITSLSAPDVTQLLEARRDILMVGLQGTMLPDAHRRLLLRRTLAHLAVADPNDMSNAWQMACPSNGFVDYELWTQSMPIIEERCSREQVFICKTMVLGLVADRGAAQSNSLDDLSQNTSRRRQRISVGVLCSPLVALPSFARTNAEAYSSRQGSPSVKSKSETCSPSSA
eukprot:TRINITY_DN48787_c0_g1_i1.p1 TRINITY_DN48787_c0_g1~~TRINITY_DN48787_c0_g1_i1.p1  ORF type:complete len:677 (+),score=74.98 TRINITY_DN48787_c0_g1_i1:35-2065(+)